MLHRIQALSLQTYQETTKQTKANFQLRSEGRGPLLQQIHPVATLIVTWAIRRDNAAVKPSARAGLLGYEHCAGGLTVTSEPCKMKSKSCRN